MEKIGVISDTHDNIYAIKEAIKIFNGEKVNFVIHAGDIVSPFTANIFKGLNCKIFLIYGNNDGDKLFLKEKFSNIGDINNDPFEINLKDKKVIVTHKPELVDALSYIYDIVIYGHTHKIDIRKENALILNPGECCGYLTGKNSVAILYPEKMDADVIEF
ncbi:MAG: metallophosphoesterase [Candidatus Thermoplasmatota archaeon]